jgi:hypothetical protein
MIVVDIDTLHHEAIQVAWQTGYESECQTALVDEIVANSIETGLRAIEPKAFAYRSENPLTQSAHGAAGVARMRQRHRIAMAVRVLTLGFAALLCRQAGAPRSRQQNRRPNLVAANLFGDVDIDPAGILSDPMPVGLVIQCCCPGDTSRSVGRKVECRKVEDRSVRAEPESPESMRTDGFGRASFPAVSWRPGCVRSLYRASDRPIRGDAAVRVRQRGFEQEQQAHDQGRRDAHYGDRGDGELAPFGGKRTERSTKVV